MEIVVDDQLREICASIEAQSLSENEWAGRESDDEFQTKNYCGGFDADEKAFCFSFFAPSGVEYWFQFSLEEASLINSGALSKLLAREAE